MSLRLVNEEIEEEIVNAAKFLPFVIAKACDEGKAYFAGEKELCDQEGCSEAATRYLKLKKIFCCDWGGCGQEKKQHGESYRKFCEKHKKRGDCGLEDADANYIEIEKP